MTDKETQWVVDGRIGEMNTQNITHGGGGAGYSDDNRKYKIGFSCYGSTKNEAIDAMIQRLETMRDD